MHAGQDGQDKIDKYVQVCTILTNMYEREYISIWTGQYLQVKMDK